MKLKIIKPSTWSQGKKDKSQWLSFTKDQILSVPEEIPQNLAADMLLHDYAVVVEGTSAELQVDPPAEKKAVGRAPENKAIVPEEENKDKNQVPAELNIEEMTRKELINYARARSITIDLKATKDELRTTILKGGNTNEAKI